MLRCIVHGIANEMVVGKRAAGIARGGGHCVVVDGDKPVKRRGADVPGGIKVRHVAMRASISVGDSDDRQR